ncbi:MAG: prolipoprotein diacylglyceryl transferase [Ilumatobacteraceae bacterium]
MTLAMIASIPSPSFNSIDIGPFSLNIYGLCIALGVVAAVWLYGKRLEEREVGTRDDASAIGIVAVLAGVAGARLYHVVTDWDRFEDNYEAIPRIWEGGLGIPGGLLVGIPVGLWMSKRKGIGIAVSATCAAPAIPLAQAIGRFGNYFNQELYGGQTDLPWALEIDPEHLVGNYAPGTTFHPTFLYESLWALGLVFVLLWIDRRFRPVDGQLMIMYLIGYGIGRFWIEGLRIDPADEFGGLRTNQWVSLLAVIGGFAVLAFWPDQSDDESEDGDTGDPTLFDDLDDDEEAAAVSDADSEDDESDAPEGADDDDDDAPDADAADGDDESDADDDDAPEAADDDESDSLNDEAPAGDDESDAPDDDAPEAADDDDDDDDDDDAPDADAADGDDDESDAAEDADADELSSG